MLKKQQGISTLNLLLVMVIAGFFLLLAFKLIPAYAENRYIQSALQSLRDRDKPVSQMTAAEIRKHITNFYTINGVRIPEANNIAIESERNRTIITINYQLTIPLFYNISVLLDFQNYMDTTKPEECCKPPKDYRPKVDKK